jgi:CRP-like cAMP-binding protein
MSSLSFVGRQIVHFHSRVGCNNLSEMNVKLVTLNNIYCSSRVQRLFGLSRRRRNLTTGTSNTVTNSKRHTTTMVTDYSASTIPSNSNNMGQQTFSIRSLFQQWKLILEEVMRKPRTLPIPRWVTPRHYPYTFSECFGHGSFVLVAASYAVDDFLLLRMIAVAGSTSMLFFAYFHPHGRVLWLPFKWNVLFIAINSYRIGIVYWNRYMSERLPDELMSIRQRTFNTMNPVDYFRLIRIAKIRDIKKGDLVLSQGEHVHQVRMVIDGQCRVYRDGKLTYLLEEGNFISEVGLHAGLLLPGKIESCCTIVGDGDGKGGPVTRILSWDRTELVHLMERDQGVRRSLKAILTWDIVRKLKAQRNVLVGHLIDDPEEWTVRRNEQTNHRYAAILHAILRKHKYLQKYRHELDRYRSIHHIDDAHHAMALAQCGWTVEEFAAGQKHRKVKRTVLLDSIDYEDDIDDNEHFEEIRDWKWYVEDIYLRFFG